MREVLYERALHEAGCGARYGGAGAYACAAHPVVTGGAAAQELRELPPAVGCAAVALHFDAGGALTRLSWLADTLAMRAGGDGDAEARGDILRCMRYHLRALRMPPAAGPSTITLPFVFD